MSLKTKLMEAIVSSKLNKPQRSMSLKTKLILGAGVSIAIGIGFVLELHRLHRRILQELVAIRQQGER